MYIYRERRRDTLHHKAVFLKRVYFALMFFMSNNSAACFCLVISFFSGVKKMMIQKEKYLNVNFIKKNISV
jgi:hypothetical protein